VRDRTGSRGLSSRVSTNSAVTSGDCMDSSGTMLYEPTQRGGVERRGGGSKVVFSFRFVPVLVYVNIYFSWVPAV
jgi:hypothetical protein